MRIQLVSEQLQVTIKQQGAELCSLSTPDGTELLWQADPGFWPRHAPLLFPIVGKLAKDTLVHQNQPYPLTQHGFARDLTFELAKADNDYTSFLLRSSEQTKEHYPFDFELMVNYTLNDAKLHVDYCLRNTQATPLWASIGAHPAFKWPLSGEDKNGHRIQFSHDEPEDIRQLNDGLLSHTTLPSPIKNKQLTLNERLFEGDALIFDRIKSREVTYEGPGSLTIRLHFADFPYLGIWKKPGANFICIEPWQGLASEVDFNGEFAEKTGVVELPSYGERWWRHTIEIIRR